MNKQTPARRRGRPPGKSIPNWSTRRFAERLRLNNMTQRDLAGILNVSEQTVSLWVHGDTTPSKDNLPKIAQALRCLQDDLVMRSAKSKK